MQAWEETSASGWNAAPGTRWSTSRRRHSRKAPRQAPRTGPSWQDRCCRSPNPAPAAGSDGCGYRTSGLPAGPAAPTGRARARRSAQCHYRRNPARSPISIPADRRTWSLRRSGRAAGRATSGRPCRGPPGDAHAGLPACPPSDAASAADGRTPPPAAPSARPVPRRGPGAGPVRPAPGWSRKPPTAHPASGRRPAGRRESLSDCRARHRRPRRPAARASCSPTIATRRSRSAAGSGPAQGARTAAAGSTRAFRQRSTVCAGASHRSASRSRYWRNSRQSPRRKQRKPADRSCPRRPCRWP